MSNTTYLEDYELSKNYEDLAIAIIQQAVRDYEREYFKTLKRGYWTSELRKLNTFFNSQWAAFLSSGKAREIRDRTKAKVEKRFKDGKHKVEGCKDRRAHLLEYNGETKSIIEWSRELGIPSFTISQRLNYGWSIEKALTTKTRRYGK